MKINNSKISDRSWGSVDKTALGNKLAESGSSAAIHEAYLYVGDEKERSTWKFPHHEVEGDELVVNRGGVHSAAQRLVSGGATESDIPKKAAANHLLKHYRAMGEEAPDSLTELAKSLTVAELVKYTSDLKASLKDAADNEQLDLIDEIQEKLDEVAELLEEVEASIRGEVEDEDDSEKAKKLKAIVTKKNLKVQIKDADRGILGGNLSLGIKKAEPKEDEEKVTREDYRPTKSQLNKINKKSPSLITKDFIDGYVFTFQATNNINNNKGIDRTLDAFSEKGLKRMGKTAVANSIPFLVASESDSADHTWKAINVYGYVLDAIVDDGALYYETFIPENDETKGILTRLFDGQISKVSVGFAYDYKDLLCSACMKSIFDESCSHYPGDEDEKGNLVYTIIDDVKDNYEFSGVAVPAQQEAGSRRHSAKSINNTTKTVENQDAGKILNSKLIKEDNKTEMDLTALLEAISKLNDEDKAKAMEALGGVSSAKGVEESDAFKDLMSEMKALKAKVDEHDGKIDEHEDKLGKHGEMHDAHKKDLEAHDKLHGKHSEAIDAHEKAIAEIRKDLGTKAASEDLASLKTESESLIEQAKKALADKKSSLSPLAADPSKLLDPLVGKLFE